VNADHPASRALDVGDEDSVTERAMDGSFSTRTASRNLLEARTTIEKWRRHYNEESLHSPPP